MQPYSTINIFMYMKMNRYYSPSGYERVYLPLHKEADTPFHIQGNAILYVT